MAKPPIDPVRWRPPPIDPLPGVPAAAINVVPVPGNAPEDVVVDADGQLWTGVDDGRIVRIPRDGGAPTVVADTGGRPLGLHVAHDGRILVCDSPRGLLALDPASGQLEALVETVEGRHLQFCSNVTELPDGTTFFTESTSAFTYAHYIAAILEARPRGNLSTGADGRIWCAMVTPANPVADRLAQWPPVVRKLVWRLPDRFHTKPESVVWGVAFDPDSGEAVAGVRTEHPSFGMVTGLVEADGRLWMGCIGAAAVAHCALP